MLEAVVDSLVVSVVEVVVEGVEVVVEATRALAVDVDVAVVELAEVAVVDDSVVEPVNVAVPPPGEVDAEETVDSVRELAEVVTYVVMEDSVDVVVRFECVEIVWMWPLAAMLAAGMTTVVVTTMMAITFVPRTT